MATKQLKELDKATYLDLYDPAEGHWYLRQRGITDYAARTAELMVDPEDSQRAERILFPVFGRNKELYGFTGRAVLDSIVPKVRDYHGLPKKDVLLGIHLLMDDDAYVVVVEGLMDYATLVDYRQPVVASLHAGITSGQRALLLAIGKPIVWMFDKDEAGIAATEAAIKSIGNHLPMTRAVYYTKVLPRSAGRQKRDPAMCSRPEIEQMIAKAVIA